MSAPQGPVCAQSQIQWLDGEHIAVATMQIGMPHCALQSANTARGSHVPVVRSTPASIGGADDAQAASANVRIRRAERTKASLRHVTIGARMIQLVWLTLLAVHAGAAGVWWWLMPGGFPSSSSEYWVNGVAPIFCVALLLTALFARGKFSHAILPAVLAMIPAFWMAFAISALLTFNESFRGSWSYAFIGGAIVAGLWVNQMRLRLTAKWLVPLTVIPALIAGWVFPGTQRSPEPATTPTGAAFGAPPPGPSDQRVIKLTKEAQIRPGESHVVFKHGNVILNAQPLLNFANRSPDRCWTSLAPEGESKPTNRVMVSKVHDGGKWSFYYKDEDASVMEVSVNKDGSVLLDGRSRLAHAVFAHNDSFGELALTGHKKLTVTFSPLPERRFDVPAATAPARFAYVDASDTFHVMQAADRARGPFSELAAAHLKHGDPIVLTIYDEDKPAFRVTFADWTAQVSTQLSPTAGYGLPVNAITMARGGDPETTPVLISFTLADTSIGRGTASVGHAPGVYRDRITVAAP